MIRRHGLKPGKDIAIEFTGIRPGEKLYEELACAGEQTRPDEPSENPRLATSPGDAEAGGADDANARVGDERRSGRSDAGVAQLRAGISACRRRKARDSVGRGRGLERAQFHRIDSGAAGIAFTIASTS